MTYKEIAEKHGHLWARWAVWLDMGGVPYKLMSGQQLPTRFWLPSQKTHLFTHSQITLKELAQRYAFSEETKESVCIAVGGFEMGFTIYHNLSEEYRAGYTYPAVRPGNYMENLVGTGLRASQPGQGLDVYCPICGGNVAGLRPLHPDSEVRDYPRFTVDMWCQSGHAWTLRGNLKGSTLNFEVLGCCHLVSNLILAICGGSWETVRDFNAAAAKHNLGIYPATKQLKRSDING